MRRALFFSAALSVAGCTPKIPEGIFACSMDDDCPNRWICDTASSRCVSDPSHAPMDAGSDVDGGSDAGPIDDTITGAIALAISPSGTDGVIEVAGDVDYYRFSASAGQWISIGVRSTASSNPRLDAAITLYDASMTKIGASSDENQDSVYLTFRAPASGDYYVKVEDESTFRAMTPEGGSTYTYSIAAEEVLPSGTSYFIESQSGSSIASAQPLLFTVGGPVTQGTVYGGFANASNVDTFSFTVPSSSDGFVEFFVTTHPSGPDGNGSTVGPGSFQITNSVGSSTIATANLLEYPMGIAVSLTPGDYLIRISPPVSLGTNPFYGLLYAMMGSGSGLMRENSNSTNGTIAMAETSMPGNRFTGWIPNSDVDNYRFDASSGQTITVSCSSALDGSGVIGLRAGLYLQSSPGVELANESETATDVIEFTHTALVSGSYVVQITKSAQSATVVGDWYHCFFSVQ